jgi:hypothetical protein
MKRCPECYDIYDESEKFCDMDGQLLLADPSSSDSGAETTQPSLDGLHLKRESWLTGLVGVMAGITLSAGGYAGYALWTIEADSKEQETRGYASEMRQPVQSIRNAPTPISHLSKAPGEEPAPDVVADVLPDSPVPAPETQTVAARLNEGPVSTGHLTRNKDSEDRVKVRTIIQMKDGTAVEVDAAWEDTQGVWYRRGGLVSFVERLRVKAITASTDPQPSNPDATVP